MYSDVRLYAHDEASVNTGYSSSDSAIRIPRILIVETDATDCELLRDILTREGFATLSRSDIHAALEILSVEPFEVVVTEIRPATQVPADLGQVTMHRRQENLESIEESGSVRFI